MRVRHLAAMFFGYHDGGRVEPERAAGITEPAPMSHGLARRFLGQTRWMGPALQPVLPYRQDTNHRCLLEHHLADQNSPWAAIR
ncbi:hypothetical protein GCM10023063_43210 [Arthrobacter methylotrophus]